MTVISNGLIIVPCRHKENEARPVAFEPSLGPPLDEDEGASGTKDFELDPPFQRVSISGEDTSGVSGWSF